MAAPVHWRRVIATLGDPGRRLAYARIVVAEVAGNPLGAPTSSAERRQVKSLVSAGLVEVRDGVLVTADPYAPLLAAEAPRVPSGPDRFLPGGRFVGLPRRESDRAELFVLIAGRVLAEGEELDEKEFTTRLSALTDAPVALRRYLVDAGTVTRDPSGAGYRRPAGG